MTWLVEIFDRLLSIVPRIELVCAYECGIKFGRGGRVKRLDPGLHIYWPLMSEVVKHPTARTTMNLPMQTLITKGGPYAVSAALVYKMTDPVKAYTENYDIDDTIMDVALVAVAEVICEEETDDLGKIGKSLTTIARRRLKPFGVHVERCSLTDIAPCRVIRNICDVPDTE